jgi:His/Glu/Gln/Arg/opine family amino acid ABC transporter permease subunit
MPMADETANVIPASRSLRDYFSDIRVIQVIAQLAFIIVLVGGLAVAWTSIMQTLDQRGIILQWNFLLSRAGFQISEAPAWYSSQGSSYGQAFLVGIINTLRVVSIGLVSATVLGILVGIFLLSSNWLVKTISRIYVEILRNTPLLVQLYFWYFIVFFALPEYATPLSLPDEGLYRIPIQYPTYLILFLIGWLVARRSKFPQALNIGIIIGVITLEAQSGVISQFITGLTGGDATMGFVLTNALNFAIFAVGLIYLIQPLNWRSFIGWLVVIFLGQLVIGWLVWVLIYLFAPSRWKALTLGVLVIMGGQLLVSFFVFIFYYLGIVPSPDALILPVNTFIYLSNKGIAMPEVLVTQQFAQWAAYVSVGLALAIGIWVYSGHVTETTGRPMPRFWYALASVLVFSLVGWSIITSQAGEVTVMVGEGDEVTEMTLTEARELDLIEREYELQVAPEPMLTVLPERGRFRFEAGTEVSLEYGALLVGLVIYTSAFIAEIVRAGIQAVPYGQIEAARALGLSQAQTLSQVVLPQALRVIIPPMGNQYLNLSKNSSLAVAVAFADTYQVGTTVMNQSGQSLVGFFLVGVVYLSLSLLISLFMNIVNSRFQLVTR